MRKREGAFCAQQTAGSIASKREGIRGSSHVILFLSEGVLSRPFVQFELGVALEAKKAVILVHEQDPSKGGCAFRHFFEVTPTDLVVAAKLLNHVAVPLYPTKEHRTVSFLGIWARMGAKVGSHAAIMGTAATRDASPSPAAPTRHRALVHRLGRATSRLGEVSRRTVRRAQLPTDEARLELADNSADANATVV